MRLREIHIENYKSLRDVRFEPTPLSVMVGPNAAGKSNFIDAIDFLSDVYSAGLEVAIQRKGGYENIAHRKQRRTKAAISFGIVADFETTIAGTDSIEFRLIHTFSIKASGAGIRAEFVVTEESFSLLIENGSSFVPFLKLNREVGAEPTIEVAEGTLEASISYARNLREAFSKMSLREQDLMMSGLYDLLLLDLATQISQWSIFQISPALTRLSAAPTPNPTLSRQGENLPAMVDWLKHKHSALWFQVISAMQEVIPDLEDISTDYTHTKTLGLQFKEQNVSRPFTAEDVSAGTLHTLAMLVAAADPRITLLCIDELENSLHPWIISVLIRRFRELSSDKTIFLTTHSPTLIDALHPGEIWIVHKKDGETQIANLTELHPDSAKDFESGDIRLSEYLGSGLVPEVVPGGVY
ncbi:MAG: AAA family ATPase [bacterium]|nr:AAA family ATPase [bacterium]